MAEPKPPRRFKSSRLIGNYEKPWLEKKDPRMKYDKIFFYGLALIGCGIGAYMCYGGWTSWPDDKFCMLWEDDFSQGIKDENWVREVQVDGFGTGSFDWTTADSDNSYTDAAGLHIVPTFTTDHTNITGDLLYDGYSVNLTTQGLCTGSGNTSCVMTGNRTAGTMINPVRSARLSTRGKHTLRYGKIEVTAKMPAGDWLWPAIWMMPQDSYYGAWPASGEIDIMETRGNAKSEYLSTPHVVGNNGFGSTLHWGPYNGLNAYLKASRGTWMRRRDYTQDFHTFGMVWTSRYIFMYQDNVLKQTLYFPFGEQYGDMYTRGEFAEQSAYNPWGQSPNYNAPFDMPFYLILNVAVGATNGYFKDGVANKPWKDSRNDTMQTFWSAKSIWESTWGEGDARGMTVKSVKMWNLC